MQSHCGTSRGPLASLALLAAGAALVACGGGGGTGPSNPLSVPHPGPLMLKYMSANRNANWERNKPIEFWFTAPLSKKSLAPGNIDKALQISIVTSKGRIPAKGHFQFFESEKPGEQFDQTKVRFIPTETANAETVGCSDNPFGFEPLTTYSVDIPTSTQSSKYLTSTDGSPILTSYTSFFITSEAYVRELDQAHYVGYNGLGDLFFEPARFINGEVPYNARVSIVFDEAMEPTSFELGTTIIVKNETLSVLQGSTVLVPGNFSSDVCGKAWKFTPSFSYGGAGYDIAVTLTSGIKDLAGNPLGNPQTIRFRTEVKPGTPTTQVLSESFDNQTFMDAVNTTADWGVATAGTLAAGTVTTVQQIVALDATQYPTGTRTRVRDHPFAQAGAVGHDQWIYTQSEMGVPAAITEIGWGPSSNALFAATHGRVIVRLGHTQGSALSTNMENNFDVGTPVTVVDAAYTIPQRATIDPPCNNDGCAVGYWPLPTFSSFFEYNGKNNVILDIDASAGTNYQITRIFFGPVGFPNRHTFSTTGSSAGTLLEPVVTDMRFTKKRRTTIAQSRFYDSGQNGPNYSPAIITPSNQTGGTSMQIEYEGAHGILFPIPGNPNNVVPDPTTYTGFVTNLDQLDTHRFVRFRITFIANVATGAIPRITSIAIPYIF